MSQYQNRVTVFPDGFIGVIFFITPEEFKQNTIFQLKELMRVRVEIEWLKNEKKFTKMKEFKDKK